MAPGGIIAASAATVSTEAGTATSACHGETATFVGRSNGSNAISRSSPGACRAPSNNRAANAGVETIATRAPLSRRICACSSGVLVT
jgi:hypothetical protein